MPTHFNRRNEGELFAENIAVSAIAQQFGTPCYVYSRAALEEHFLAYQRALGDHPHLICYAVKANSNIAVLNVLARLGAGFDIVSLGELQRVLMAGGSAAKVVFSGVGKQDHEIEEALRLGIHCFNVESETELVRIDAIAGRTGKTANISIRVNPDVDAQTHPYIATGLKENKFGIDINEAPRVYQQAATMPNLCIKGIDCHIGSQLTSTQPFLDALDRVLQLADSLVGYGITIEHLDLGGGLGVTYRDETPPTPQHYIASILDKLGGRPFKLLFEPGRSIAANAGIFVTRVNLLKNTAEKHFAVVDGAMNDLIRPALYQAYQHIEPVLPSSAPPQIYDVVGPVCETGDFLGKNRKLAVEAGDLLAVFSSGAYGFVMSSNYNSRGRAAEIMVDGNSASIVRQRETFADLVRGESLLPEA
ncbi:MAG: diaminopimelate decarboxylase [Pseudomonadales bacterium]|nr:diaminopimelate decarboxylase [Pseudomonadales bacterium]